MSGQLKITTVAAHTAGRPFRVVVEVSGARPGDPVRIRLRLAAAEAPPWSCAPTIIDAGGEGLAVFEGVIVHGAGSIARLVAEVEEAVTPLRSDEVLIEVLP